MYVVYFSFFKGAVDASLDAFLAGWRSLALSTLARRRRTTPKKSVPSCTQYVVVALSRNRLEMRRRMIGQAAAAQIKSSLFFLAGDARDGNCSCEKLCKPSPCVPRAFPQVSCRRTLACPSLALSRPSLVWLGPSQYLPQVHLLRLPQLQLSWWEDG